MHSEHAESRAPGTGLPTVSISNGDIAIQVRGAGPPSSWRPETALKLHIMEPTPPHHSTQSVAGGVAYRCGEPPNLYDKLREHGRTFAEWLICTGPNRREGARSAPAAPLPVAAHSHRQVHKP